MGDRQTLPVHTNITLNDTRDYPTLTINERHG
jgi:hypothetical protein